MLKFVIRRLLAMIPVLFIISVVTFSLMKLTPGGPWDKGEGRREMSQQQRELLDRKYNLDKPDWEQYLLYMAGAIRGDLGPSLQYRDRNVTELLFDAGSNPFWESKFGRSATLGLLAITIAVIIGLPLGILAAVKQNTWMDYISLFLATTGVSVPSFVMAIFFILIFSYSLHLLPTTAIYVDRDWRAWVMPVAVLSFTLVAFLARLTRATMLETIRQDYIRTARAKGLMEQVVIFKHALKNSLIPVATVLGPAVAGLITGTFFIEYMFSFPGMGRFFVQSVQQRDYSMIMGTTLFYALLISLANLSVDVVYGWLDPRIKVS